MPPYLLEHILLFWVESVICQEYTYIKMAQIEKIVCIEKKDCVLGYVGAGDTVPTRYSQATEASCSTL